MIIFNETHDDATYATNLCYWMFDFKKDLNNCRFQKKKKKIVQKKREREREREREKEREQTTPLSQRKMLGRAYSHLTCLIV